jgi:hypothetical protein
MITTNYTLGFRHIDGQIEMSAITEVDDIDLPNPDKINSVVMPHLNTIRYFSTSRILLEAIVEGHNLSLLLADANYFVKFIGKHKQEYETGVLTRIEEKDA